jgi:ribonuclease HI
MMSVTIGGGLTMIYVVCVELQIFGDMRCWTAPCLGVFGPWLMQNSQMCRSEEGDARLWLFNLVDTLSTDEQVKVFTTLWSIWHARRKAIQEQVFQSPVSTIVFMERYFEDLKQCKPAPDKRASASHASTASGWLPPPPGIPKINMDAMVGKGESRGAVAAVARSATRQYLGASAMVFPGKSTPETLEALACREGLALARDIHACKVCVASDCKMESGFLGDYAVVVRELQDSRLEFEHLSSCHEKMIHNIEAHNLARSVVLDGHGRQV